MILKQYHEGNKSVIPKKKKPLIPKIKDDEVMSGTNLFGDDDDLWAIED